MTRICDKMVEAIKMIQRVFLEPHEKIVWMGAHVSLADNDEYYVTLEGNIKIDPMDETLLQTFTISIPVDIAVNDDPSTLFDYFVAEKDIMDASEMEHTEERQGLLH